MCAISINTTGFTGELRFPLGFTTPAQKPLASQKTTNVWRSIKDKGTTQRYFCAAFQTALAGDVCHLQTDCHRGRFGSSLGAGSQDPAVLSTAFQAAADSIHKEWWKSQPKISSSPGSVICSCITTLHTFVMQERWPSLKISCYG